MQEHAVGKAAFKIGKHTGWIGWAGRHPGIVLLGALMMAILSAQQSSKASDAERDSSGEDVPLFI
jgi:hypothetical protein